VVGDDVVELAGDGEPLVLAHEIEVAAALVIHPAQVQPHPCREGEAEAVRGDAQAVVADVRAGIEHRDEAGADADGDGEGGGRDEAPERPAQEQQEAGGLGDARPVVLRR
jgi:hypothetical protein